MRSEDILIPLWHNISKYKLLYDAIIHGKAHQILRIYTFLKIFKQPKDDEIVKIKFDILKITEESFKDIFNQSSVF